MRRPSVWLSIAVVCLGWTLGAPAIRAEVSASARTALPQVALSPTAATVQLAAVVPTNPLRGAPPVQSFAILAAALALLVSGCRDIAARSRRWADAFTRSTVRTRGPPFSPTHLPAAS